ERGVDEVVGVARDVPAALEDGAAALGAVGAGVEAAEAVAAGDAGPVIHDEVGLGGADCVRVDRHAWSLPVAEGDAAREQQSGQTGGVCRAGQARTWAAASTALRKIARPGVGPERRPAGRRVQNGWLNHSR